MSASQAYKVFDILIDNVRSTYDNDINSAAAVDSESVA